MRLLSVVAAEKRPEKKYFSEEYFSVRETQVLRKILLELPGVFLLLTFSHMRIIHYLRAVQFISPNLHKFPSRMLFPLAPNTKVLPSPLFSRAIIRKIWKFAEKSWTLFPHNFFVGAKLFFSPSALCSLPFTKRQMSSRPFSFLPLLPFSFEKRRGGFVILSRWVPTEGEEEDGEKGLVLLMCFGLKSTSLPFTRPYAILLNSRVE